METYEFLGDNAEGRLIAHVVGAESRALRDVGGVLVCGGNGGLREWLAADMASVTGGALVSHFITVQAPAVDRARKAGLGVVLFTAMDPETVLAHVRSGEMAGHGWPPGEAGVEFFTVAVPRFAHITSGGSAGGRVLKIGFLR